MTHTEFQINLFGKFDGWVAQDEHIAHKARLEARRREIEARGAEMDRLDLEQALKDVHWNYWATEDYQERNGAGMGAACYKDVKYGVRLQLSEDLDDWDKVAQVSCQPCLGVLDRENYIQTVPIPKEAHAILFAWADDEERG